MEKLKTNEQRVLTNGEQKVLEYIGRIKNGEKSESVLDGLPPSFVNAVNEGLRSEESVSEESSTGEIKETEIDMRTAEEQKKQEVDKEQRILSDAEEIKKVREKLGISNPDESKNENNLEKYKISFPNLDEIIKKGAGQLEIFSNGAKVEFEEFAVGIDGDSAEVLFIRKKDPTQNKGIGVPIYIELGKRLSEKGIKLYSSGAQYGPGKNIWIKLSKLGFTQKSNGGYVFKTN